MLLKVFFFIPTLDQAQVIYCMATLDLHVNFKNIFILTILSAKITYIMFVLVYDHHHLSLNIKLLNQSYDGCGN